MTNKELINAISTQTGMTKKSVGEMLQSTIEIILDRLAEGKQVSIQEFGTFEMRQKNERVSVHPVTKERTIVPAKRQITFKQSPSLKEKINQR